MPATDSTATLNDLKDQAAQHDPAYAKAVFDELSRQGYKLEAQPAEQKAPQSLGDKALDTAKAFGRQVGIDPSDLRARFNHLVEHPVDTFVEALKNPPILAGAKMVGGIVKHGQEQVGEAYDALTTQEASFGDRLAAAASHLISALPVVGPALDEATEAAQARGMNAPHPGRNAIQSYWDNLKIAATTPITVGTAAGAAANVAGLKEGFAGLKDAVGAQMKGEALPPAPEVRPPEEPPVVEAKGPGPTEPPPPGAPPAPVEPPAAPATPPTTPTGWTVRTLNTKAGPRYQFVDETGKPITPAYSSMDRLYEKGPAHAKKIQAARGQAPKVQELHQAVTDAVADHAERLAEVRQELEKIDPANRQAELEAINKRGLEAYQRWHDEALDPAARDAARQEAAQQVLRAHALDQIIQENVGTVLKPGDQIPKPAEPPAPEAGAPPAPPAPATPENEFSQEPPQARTAVAVAERPEEAPPIPEAQPEVKAKGKKAKLAEAGQEALPFTPPEPAPETAVVPPEAGVPATATEQSPSTGEAAPPPVAAPVPPPQFKLTRTAGPITMWHVPDTNIRIILHPSGYVVNDGDQFLGRADTLGEASAIAEKRFAPEKTPTPEESYAAALARTYEENAGLATASKSTHRDVPVLSISDDTMVLLDRLAGIKVKSNGKTMSAQRARQVINKLRNPPETVTEEGRTALRALADLMEAHRTPNGNVVLHRSILDAEAINRVLLEELFHDWQMRHLTGDKAAQLDATMRSGTSGKDWENILGQLRKDFKYKHSALPTEAPAWVASGYDFGIGQEAAVRLLVNYFDAAGKILGDEAVRNLPPMAEGVSDAVSRGLLQGTGPDTPGGGGGRVDTQQPATGGPAAGGAAEAKPAPGKGKVGDLQSLKNEAEERRRGELQSRQRVPDEDDLREKLRSFNPNSVLGDRNSAALVTGKGKVGLGHLHRKIADAMGYKEFNEKTWSWERPFFDDGGVRIRANAGEINVEFGKDDADTFKRVFNTINALPGDDFVVNYQPVKGEAPYIIGDRKTVLATLDEWERRGVRSVPAFDTPAYWRQQWEFQSRQPDTLESLKKEAEQHRPEPAPTWFIKSERVIGDKMKGPMDGPALLKMLQNNGVKPDELKWTGLDDYLSTAGRVTPDGVRKFISENGIKIEEVEKGPKRGEPRQIDPNELELTTDTYQYRAENPLTGRISAVGKGTVDSPEEAREYLAHHFNHENFDAWRQSAEGTKYGTYVLPNGENYRELLLTLPVRSKPLVYPEPLTELPPEYDMMVDERPNGTRYGIAQPGRNYAMPVGYHWHRTPEEAKAAALEFLNYGRNEQAANKWREEHEKGKFTESHWNEPNVLVHVRMNDRIAPNGSSLLHLEEIQSDWHQKGRKRGYGEPDTTGWYAEPSGDGDGGNDERFGWWNVYNTNGERMGTTRRYNAATAEDAVAKVAETKKGPPDAPFKKTWQEMALRRMIRYAAENGYDGLSWTGGEEHAARYDLSKQISKINYDAHDGRLTADSTDNRRVFDRYGVTPQDLPDYIGKDAANKLMAIPVDEEGGRELSGLDLKVGGEGMHGFYDKIVPDYLNKFGKKFGVQVGKTTLDVTEPAKRKKNKRYDRRQLSFDWGAGKKPFGYLPINDAMRDSVLGEGVEMFSLQPDSLEALKEEAEQRQPDRRNNLRWTDIRTHLLPEERKGYEGKPDLQQKLVEAVNMMPNGEEWDAAIRAGKIGSLWYERSARAFDALTETMPEMFQPGDKEKFLNFVAALSPVQTVRLNLVMAINVWDKWNKAGRPQDVEWNDPKRHSGVKNKNAKLYRILKGYGNTPGVEMETRMPNAIRALQGQPLHGPKVSSFAPNLGEDTSKSTNDTWMAVFADTDPNTINKKHFYDAVSAHVRMAGKKNGIPARQAQAAIWSFIKSLAELSGWGNDRWIPPQDILNQGLLTPELVAAHSADFADLLQNDPEIRAKIQKIGGDLDAFDRRLKEIVPSRPAPEGEIKELAKRLLGAANRLEAARADLRVQEHLERKSDQQSSLFGDTSFDFGDPLEELKAEAARLKPQ